MARVLKPTSDYPPDWGAYRWPTKTLLSFDQSLANTGWSLIRFSEHHREPKVMLYGLIETPPIAGLTGFDDSLTRGEQLCGSISDVLAICWNHSRIDTIIHEMPAMMGMTVSTKMEGPPISALAVRLAVRRHPTFDIRSIPIVMMQNNKMKKWITGSPKATKAEVRQGVFRVVDKFHTNEHVADSLALAVASVADQDLEDKIEAWRAAR